MSKEKKSLDRTGFRLRRGFGTIRYLGEGRKNPYAVHPPAVRVVRECAVVYVRPKAICYVSDWFQGFAVLAAWHAGAYTPGLEDRICTGYPQNTSGPAAEPGDDLARLDWREYCTGLQKYLLGQRTGSQKSLMGQSAGRQKYLLGQGEGLESSVQEPDTQHQTSDIKPRTPAPESMTVAEVYKRFYDYKFGPGAARKLSESCAAHTRSNFKRLETIAGRPMDDLTIDELQRLINAIRSCKTVVTQTMILIKQLYKYALPRGYCSLNPAQYLKTPDLREQRHFPDFTDPELGMLWRHSSDPVVKMILIFCYSGFRLSAFEHMEINLEERYFRGGVKTAAGRGRVVPIHSLIFPYAEELKRAGTAYLCTGNKARFAQLMKRKLAEIGMDGAERHHTPHSCRHTFSRLCESYGVREADRKRLLGHSFGNDITNGVYGHRTLEELRAEIEKIRKPDAAARLAP